MCYTYTIVAYIMDITSTSQSTLEEWVFDRVFSSTTVDILFHNCTFYIMRNIYIYGQTSDITWRDRRYQSKTEIDLNSGTNKEGNKNTH